MHHGEFFWNSKSLELPFLGFRLEIGQILTWKAVIYEKSLVSDFRKTVPWKPVWIRACMEMY